MTIKTVFFSAVVTIGVAAAQPVSAASPELDGALPMYPHGKLDAKESSLTPAAISAGVPLVLLTADSVSTVETWYAAHLPKTCSQQTASGGTKFACPGGSIMVYSHGGSTQVALIPPMPGMPGR